MGLLTWLGGGKGLHARTAAAVAEVDRLLAEVDPESLLDVTKLPIVKAKLERLLLVEIGRLHAAAGGDAEPRRYARCFLSLARFLPGVERSRAEFTLFTHGAADLADFSAQMARHRASKEALRQRSKTDAARLERDLEGAGFADLA